MPNAQSNQAPVNPLRTLRLSMEIPTVDAMANIANIRTAAISQAEDGLYPKPLPGYLMALGIELGSPEEVELTKAYLKYQTDRRKFNGPQGQCKLIENPRFSLNENPLATWREQSGLAVYGLAAAYCIHLPLVNKFEKAITSFKENPPSGILVPLKEAGYDTEEFEEASQIYKAALYARLRELNSLKAS